MEVAAGFGQRLRPQLEDVNVGWSGKLSQHYHVLMNFLSRAWRPSATHKVSSRNFHSTVKMQGDYNVRN